MGPGWTSSTSYGMGGGRRKERTRTSEDVRMAMSDHYGWKISVIPAERGGSWTATAFVWEPGTGPGTHGGLRITFSGQEDSQYAVQEAARLWAERHIDRVLRCDRTPRVLPS